MPLEGLYLEIALKNRAKQIKINTITDKFPSNYKLQ